MIIYKTNKIQQTNQIHLMNVSSNESDSSNKEGSAYETKVLNVVDSFDVNNSTSNKGSNKMSKSKSNNDSKTNESDSKIESLQDDLNRLQDELNSKDEIILDLQVKLEKQMSLKDGRKSQVLDILKNNESVSILEISSELDISTKNVSSQLTYLRQDGYKIFTDHNGRKVLMT